MSALDLLAPTVHPAQVAGAFYPADPAALARKIDAFLESAPSSSVRAKMIVTPHAGLDYCGAVAARAAKAVDAFDGPRRVVILGPNHRVPLDGVALHPASSWLTPLGETRVDARAIEALARLPGVRVDASPFQGEHSLEVPLAFLQRALRIESLVPVLVGAAAPELVENVLRHVWGGPETLIVISSDLSHFLAADAARATDAATRAMIETGQWSAVGPGEACGFASLRGAMRRAGELRMRATGLAFATSDQAGGPANRVVGYGGFAFEYQGVARLSDADRRRLIHIASGSLRFASNHGGAKPNLLSRGGSSAPLIARRGAFVTLEKDGALRGCVGSAIPATPLAGDVAINAVKAGFGDPRFGPLAPDELAGLSIKIAVLSPMSPIAARDERDLISQLRPDRDGLVLREGPRAALFLPSVWEQLPDPADFLRHLKRKMGLSADHVSTTMTAERFDVESFGGAYVAEEELDLGEMSIEAAG